MTVLTWAIRLIIFVVLLVFAVQNTDPVSLRFFTGQIWQAPLVLVLLVFFVGGVLLGVTSLFGVVFRQRREITRLQRAVNSKPVSEPVVPPPL